KVEGPPHFQSEKRRRRHAGHDERVRADRHGPADYGGITAKLPLPEPIADHRARTEAAAATIVVRREDAAQHRLHAENMKEVAADPQPGGLAEFAVRRDLERFVGPGDEA